MSWDLATTQVEQVQMASASENPITSVLLKHSSVMCKLNGGDVESCKIDLEVVQMGDTVSVALCGLNSDVKM